MANCWLTQQRHISANHTLALRTVIQISRQNKPAGESRYRYKRRTPSRRELVKYTIRKRQRLPESLDRRGTLHWWSKEEAAHRSCVIAGPSNATWKTRRKLLPEETRDEAVNDAVIAKSNSRSYLPIFLSSSNVGSVA